MTEVLKKAKSSLLFLAFLLLVIACWYADRYKYSPDYFSYIWLGKRWSELDLGNAINAYWGPLFPMLIGILIKLGIPPLLCPRILNMLLLLVVYSVFKRKLIPTSKDTLVFILLLILLIPMAFFDGTSDFLFATVFLLIFEQILNRSIDKSPFYIGILGALLYMSKAIGFYIFTAMLLYFLIYYIKDRAKLISVFRMAIAFLAISSLSILAIHYKYHIWSLGTSGVYNLKLIGPQSQGHYFLTDLEKTKSPFWAWIDPTYLQKNPAWSPFASQANFKFYISHVLDNVKDVRTWIYYKAFFIIGFLLLYLTIRHSDKTKNSKQYLIVLFSLSVYAFLYFVVISHERYLYGIYLVLFYLLFRAYPRRINSYIMILGLIMAYQYASYGLAYNTVRNLLTENWRGALNNNNDTHNEILLYYNKLHDEKDVKDYCVVINNIDLAEGAMLGGFDRKDLYFRGLIDSSRITETLHQNIAVVTIKNNIITILK